MTSATSNPPARAAAILIVMLSATTILSQFFRTSVTVLAPELIVELKLTSKALGMANAIFFFALMAASLYLLRQRGDYRPAFRLKSYAVLCGVFVVSSAAIVIHHLVSQPRRGLIGLAIVLAGLPVYWIWTRRRVPAGAHA